MKNVDITEQLENIQEEIINAGGRFMKQEEIRYMRIEDLLNICVCNHIDFSIKYNRIEYDEIKTGMKEFDNIMKEGIPVDYFEFFTGRKF